MDENSIRRGISYAFAMSFPVVLALSLVWTALSFRAAGQIDPEELWLAEKELVKLNFVSAHAMERYFERWEYQWLPAAGSSVPPFAVMRFPEDLRKVSDTKRKKSLFFRALLPIVLAENKNIRHQRQRLVDIVDMPAESRSVMHVKWAENLRDWYRVKGDVFSPLTIEKLLNRIDEIPLALVLAQAANESAWGTSRFAVQGNNLFGVWTYDEAKGMVPTRRDRGQRHAVAIYPNIRASVRAYLRNLNTHRAYARLRALRKAARAFSASLDAEHIATGLESYSERGKAYIDDIQALIRMNDLSSLREISLTSRQQAFEFAVRHIAEFEATRS